MDKKFLKRGNTSLNEVYSSTNVIEFSLLNDELKPLHIFFRCKDYYQEVFLGLHKKIKLIVYGYNNQKIVDLPLDKVDKIINNEFTTICLRYRKYDELFSNEAFVGLSTFENNMNTLLTKLGFKPLFLSIQEKHVEITYDTRINYNVFFFSLFTSLIRLFLLNKVNVNNFQELFVSLDKCNGNDAMNLKISLKNLKNINLEELYIPSIVNDFSFYNYNFKDSVVLHNTGYKAIFLKGYPFLNNDKNKTFKDMIEEIDLNTKKSREREHAEASIGELVEA